MPRVKEQQATVEQLKALAHPMRWRILRLCRDSAHTNQELAQRLGVAAPTMHRHVKMLASQGFLVAEEVRSGRRGAMERPYRATRLTLTLALHTGTTEAQEVDLAALNAHRAEVVEAGPNATRQLARGVTRLGPDSQRELTRRMTELVDEYRDRDDPDGEPLSFLWHLIRYASD